MVALVSAIDDDPARSSPLGSRWRLHGSVDRRLEGCLAGRNGAPMEYLCHENNPDLGHLVGLRSGETHPWGAFPLLE
jgi:hypothetical protein